MQFGQNNIGRSMINGGNNNTININNNRNLTNMNVRFTNGPKKASTIAGINKMPQFDRNARFANVKIDRDPAKQIMNSAGQNVIQNKIRDVKDLSAN